MFKPIRQEGDNRLINPRTEVKRAAVRRQGRMDAAIRAFRPASDGAGHADLAAGSGGANGREPSGVRYAPAARRLRATCRARSDVRRRRRSPPNP